MIINKDFQSLRPTSGQLRVLTLLLRGMRIERAITATVGNGSPPTLRYIADDGLATVIPRPSIEACLTRGWAEINEETKLLRLTKAGEDAIRHFNGTKYNVRGR